MSSAWPVGETRFLGLKGRRAWAVGVVVAALAVAFVAALVVGLGASSIVAAIAGTAAVGLVAFLWWIQDAPALSRKARAAIARPENECLLSLPVAGRWRSRRAWAC